jgi:hypothetical protein
MKKMKKFMTLMLTTTLISTSFLSAATPALAQGGAATVLEQGIGQAHIPLLQEQFNNPSYYYSGLPRNIVVETREFDSENVVLDVKFNSPVYVGNRYLLAPVSGMESMETGEYRDILRFIGIPIKAGHRDDFAAKFTNMFRKIDLSNLRVKGYIRKDKKVVEYFNELIDGLSDEHLDKAVIPKGEVAFSIILKKDSPLINGIKVERQMFFEKLRSSTVIAGQSARLDYSTTIGVTNEEAFSIAKTVGSSLSFGLSGSKGPLSASLGLELQQSLTKTFSTSYSVTKTETLGEAHTFDGAGRPSRRVGIYRYGEKYTSKPQFNQSLKSNYPFLKPTTSTIMYMRSIQALDIEKPSSASSSNSADASSSTSSGHSSSNSGLVPNTNDGNTNTNSQQDPAPELTSLGEVSQLFRGLNKNIPYMRDTHIREIRQLSGKSVKYNSREKGFLVDGRSTFEITIDIAKEGLYDLGIDLGYVSSFNGARLAYLNNQGIKDNSISANQLGTPFLESGLRLKKGTNKLRITTTGVGMLKKIVVERNTDDAYYRCGER